MDNDDNSTKPMIIGKGVLQGGCLSPLLFSMIVNTLIKSKNGKVRCMGYSSSKTLLLRHW